MKAIIFILTFFISVSGFCQNYGFIKFNDPNLAPVAETFNEKLKELKETYFQTAEYEFVNEFHATIKDSLAYYIVINLGQEDMALYDGIKVQVLKPYYMYYAAAGEYSNGDINNFASKCRVIGNNKNSKSLYVVKAKCSNCKVHYESIGLR